MARRYALGSLVEARAYWGHPVLGPRLVDCTRLVNAVKGRSAHEIFGSPDDLKFQSSMTLFARAVPEEGEFGKRLPNISAEARTGGRSICSKEDGMTENDPARDAARLDALEIRIAYQDETIEELSAALTRQWQEIDKLRREMTLLEAALQEAQAGPGENGPEPPPPHY